MTGRTLLRSALLTLLGLAVISGGSLATGDLFDDDYSDCPHGTRFREGQIADLTVARDADAEDEVNVAWTTTDPATWGLAWGLGPNTFNASLVVILDDGDDLDTRTLSLGAGKTTFTDVKTGTEVKVQMAIVVDTPDGGHLISDILEVRVHQSLSAPAYTTDITVIESSGFVHFKLVPVGTFYYVGYNERFGNYRADGLLTRPRTARLRIGLANTEKQADGRPYKSDAGPYEDADFDAYIMRITDEGGDVVPGADDVATVASEASYQTALTVGKTTPGSSASNLANDDRVLSNVRINDGGKISVAMQNLSSLPFTPNTITPANQGLSFINAPPPDVDSLIFALAPDEHRDFPIDMLASDETYKFTAWAVNDRGTIISPVASLTVRPVDKEANISSVTDYANTGTSVTNAYVTEFTVFK
ncbi:MAG: hypothetical protein F4X16_16300 [Caldilineaceae bacterium SB0661_bin_34]|nr:hypothetical protein [Caldilineaceae bacterium SB0661_bin_34]